MGGEFEGRNCVESLTADEGEDEGGKRLENGKKRAFSCNGKRDGIAKQICG